MGNIKEFAAKKVLIFDGAMGTMIQQLGVTAADYEGYEGCNEYLSISRPDLITNIHKAYYDAGADIVETNSCGANPMILSEYGLEDRVYEINVAAAKVARIAANQSGGRRFVSGSTGPGTKLPSLGQIDFDTLSDGYYNQTLGLIDGGVDCLQIETSQDLLQVKAAIDGLSRGKERRKSDIPIIVQVTLEKNGQMLLGSDIQTVIATLTGYDIWALGINCGTGPFEMREAVGLLSKHSPFKISLLPNAGFPEMIDGAYRYNLVPEDFGREVSYLVNTYGVNLAGGCCGTSPDHIKALVKLIQNTKPKERTIEKCSGFSSLYRYQESDITPKPLILGERTNATGSKKFRELLLADDDAGVYEMALDQELEGAHLIDINLSYAGRREIEDWKKLIVGFNRQLRAPISIDTTDIDVMEGALKGISGKPVINSMNLEDGGIRAQAIFKLAKRFNAGIVCLTIDEQGMALTAERKIAVAKRIYKMATQQYGIPPEHLLIDALTFTLASGDPQYSNSALETLNGIKGIKEQLPGVLTVLGLSNVSFGLKPKTRRILNSVFLEQAVVAGLDCAILHAGKLAPAHLLPKDAVTAAEDLIYNRSEDALERLMTFGVKGIKKTVSDLNLTPPERLQQMVIDGRQKGLEDLLEEALQTVEPLDLLNNYLLGGMKIVGALFGSGKMQLPFVLKSASVMKQASNLLKPYLKQRLQDATQTILLATVKGDIHDIGKNLVDIILSNNGYSVHNIGVDQSAQYITEAVQENKPDCVGLSGLLVQSAKEMKSVLERFNDANITVPVLCGGAALTESFITDMLTPIYKGSVYYARDPFDAVKILSDAEPVEVPINTHPAFQAPLPRGAFKETKDTEPVEVSGEQIPFCPECSIPRNNNIPTPPFWGSRMIDVDLDHILPLVNRKQLFNQHWGYYKKGLTIEARRARFETEFPPIFREMIALARKKDLLIPQGVYGYFNAYAEGNRLHVGEENSVQFDFPAQKEAPHMSLAGYFNHTTDLLPVYVVTVGAGATAFDQELFAAEDFATYHHWHGFSVALAEAMAEYIHRLIRRELNIDGDDHSDPIKLIKGNYQGCRYSFGYQLCPDLGDQKKLFKLLSPERIGVSLSSSYQMIPEQSTSGLVLYQSDAAYFKL